ncbi:tail fiber protein [Cronobacter phage vB_CsaP_009]|uniref:Uncharacterized protein n=1 Tax=Cronobacter phage vB_CsaP_009 TaxID=2699738 RepID=A0A679FBU6_9CAUD|nr:tail fiber protein [Cronobacter phage vB_CsaP_009]BBU72698.1 hypothetical protein [Cronobacter phage vB_CsaP_009]
MSEEVKISIARALVRIKTITDRLSKGADGNIVEVAIGKDQQAKPRNPVYKTIEDAEKAVTSNFQSIIDLIKERSHLKQLVNLSNATTVVTISGKNYTIAEAIDLKNMCSHQLNMIAHWKANVLTESSRVNLINTKLSDSIAEKTKNLTSATAEMVEAVRVSEEKSGYASLIDPLKVSTKLKEMETDLNDFAMEVDVAINEINSVTMITL